MGSEFTIPIEASPARRADLRRMQMLQKRSKVSGWQEKSLREALIELDKICEDLAIPKGVKGEASVIYRKARSKGITGGRDLRQVLGAVVFVVCRIRALPRTEKEVIDSLVARYGFERRSSMKTLRKISRRLSHELGLEMRRIPADEYIDKFSSQMSLSRAVIEQAHELHRRTPKRYTGTKSPILAAAVFIYLGAREVDEGLTLKKVAESLAVGISSLSQNVTRFKDILEAER
jgi:transcription initiation factor TFIIB